MSYFIDNLGFVPEKKCISYLYNILGSEDCEFETVKQLLGINKNLALKIESTFEKNTTLHVAAMNPFCKAEVIQLLISEGVSVSAKNHNSYTALHLALLNRVYNYDVINVLINNGSPLNDIDCHNPLIVAVQNPNCDSRVINALLNAGCDVNKTDRGSALYHLIDNKNCTLEAVKLLLDAGAQVDCDVQRHIASSSCKTEIILEVNSRNMKRGIARMGRPESLQQSSHHSRKKFKSDV